MEITCSFYLQHPHSYRHTNLDRRDYIYTRLTWTLVHLLFCLVYPFCIISTKIFRRSLAYSQAEYQKLRFGGLGAELLRGWIGGWQIFMNMFVIGWVSIAMGKVCSYMFGWPIWVGGPLFTILVFSMCLYQVIGV